MNFRINQTYKMAVFCIAFFAILPVTQLFAGECEKNLTANQKVTFTYEALPQDIRDDARYANYVPKLGRNPNIDELKKKFRAAVYLSHYSGKTIPYNLAGVVADAACHRAMDYLTALGIPFRHELVSGNNNCSLVFDVDSDKGLNAFSSMVRKRLPRVKIVYLPERNFHRNFGAMYSDDEHTIYVGHENIIDSNFANGTLLHEFEHAKTYARIQSGISNPLYGESRGDLPVLPELMGESYLRFQSHDEPIAYMISLKRFLKTLQNYIGKDNFGWAYNYLSRQSLSGFYLSKRNMQIADLHLNEFKKTEDINYDFIKKRQWVELDLLYEDGAKRITTLLPISNERLQEDQNHDAIIINSLTELREVSLQYAKKYKAAHELIYNMYDAAKREDFVEVERLRKEAYLALLKND